MPGDEGEPPSSPRLGKGRMEAFSDGVFAIAVTLLVLDIALHPPGSPLRQVLEAWPFYFAYLVSFVTISAAWLAHSALTDRLEHVDPILLRLNVLLLLVVGFLPFPTELVASALHDVSGERVFITFYGLTVLVLRVIGIALDGYARREHLYARHDEAMTPRSGREILVTVAIYAVATLIGFAVPILGVALFFGIALFFVWPVRSFYQMFHRH